MRTVVNEGPGGMFGLSDEAVEWCVRRGMTCTDWTPNGEPADPAADFVRMRARSAARKVSRYCILTGGRAFRTHPTVVACVEELGGERASGRHARLAVVDRDFGNLAGAGGGRKCVRCRAGETRTAFCDGCVRKYATPLSDANAGAVWAAIDEEDARARAAGVTPCEIFYLFGDCTVVSRSQVDQDSKLLLSSTVAGPWVRQVGNTRLVSQECGINVAWRHSLPIVIGRNFMRVVHPRGAPSDKPAVAPEAR